MLRVISHKQHTGLEGGPRSSAMHGYEDQYTDQDNKAKHSTDQRKRAPTRETKSSKIRQIPAE
jgi:hypothetical protein